MKLESWIALYEANPIQALVHPEADGFLETPGVYQRTESLDRIWALEWCSRYVHQLPWQEVDLWTADCLETFLPAFDMRVPDEPRLRFAIAQRRAYANGTISYGAMMNALDKLDSLYSRVVTLYEGNSAVRGGLFRFIFAAKTTSEKYTFCRDLARARSLLFGNSNELLLEAAYRSSLLMQWRTLLPRLLAIQRP